MPNQSLDKFIFRKFILEPFSHASLLPGGELDWPKRANIIEGIAQGLLYLHRYSRVRVIHRDLKASNILLDGEWNPKISDFGLARIFTWNDAPANTKHIVGTGYISPEYAMKGHFSVKSDVFSYGILVLEILSGKRNTSTPDLDEALNLSGHAWKLWRSDSVVELMDPVLAGTCSAVEFSRCVHVALLCVQENPADRPTMLDVVSMLNNESTTLSAPNRPAYLLERFVMREDGQRVERRVNSSTNEITYSEMGAR
ncbi:unnamed protein product [Spirodela intermedia]|uniref:Protein kinase domain-containing protein n=1 Tax=Spirodela intermedia TaxID=51605 RepID=A0A7I8K9W5_SPIIN|nr:unnamed protein product [Spirodela intermedia]